MAIFQLDGVVSALSPGAAGKDRLAIDYLEISGGGGSTTRLPNVSVAREVASILKVGAAGKFFFRDLGATNCLLGIERADGVQAFDLQDATVRRLQGYVERTFGGAESGGRA